MLICNKKSVLSVLTMMAFAPAVFAQPAPAPAGGGGRGPAAPPARSIGIALALEAAQTAVAACTANNYNVSVTVLDAGGVTRLIYANDKAAGGPINSATRKAYTALAFKEPTAVVATQQTADPAVDAKIKADPKMFARAGGFPLMAGTELVGAIGVGGAPGGDWTRPARRRASTKSRTGSCSFFLPGPWRRIIPLFSFTTPRTMLAVAAHPAVPPRQHQATLLKVERDCVPTVCRWLLGTRPRP